MKLNLEVTEQDFVQAHFLHIRPRRWIKIAGVIMILLIIVVLVVNLYKAIFRHDGFYVALFLAIGGVYLFGFFFFYIPRKLRRLYKQWKYRLTSECEIDDSVVSIHNSLGNVGLPWDYFRRWRENKHLFILYPVDNLFHIFPKHCFTSEQDINDFKKLLTQKLGENSR